MNYKELILKNRSYRRYHESYQISEEQLTELVNYARLSASSANIQSNKFFISNTREQNEEIYSCLAWAGYLKDWKGPASGERPSAYIVVLADSEIHATIEVDVGIAAQSITLGATSMGLGACLIGSVSRGKLRKLLQIPEQYQIPLVIALGKPAEEVVIEETNEDRIEYWRDANDIHHVPKRPLGELIVKGF